MEKALNNFQAWALENPNQLPSKIFLPIISFVEGLIANNPTYLDAKRISLGSNFCCAGQVVLGDFTAVETALTSPQARTWRLGASLLDQNYAPNLDVGGRNLFLLALSDGEVSRNSSDNIALTPQPPLPNLGEGEQDSPQNWGARGADSPQNWGARGANNDHEAFRRCMQKYLLNDAAIARQQDAIAQNILNKLAADYREMPHGFGGKFFTDDQRGWMGFLVRYLHYVIFGINPDDREKIALLTDLYYTRQSPLHYFAIVGKVLQNLKLFGHGNLQDLIEQAATIYENSPALANFTESAEFNGMSRRELAKLMTAIMGIAGMQGPLHLGYTAMGYRPLPAYKGRHTANINLTDYWDGLDLEDRNAVQLYLLECARLWAPVSATHRVATEPFQVKIGEKDRTFPAGTKLLIPIILALLDEGFWGSSTYEFNAQRENLCPYHTGFHSVGDRSAGRICPGKDIALNMLTDVLITVGKVRRLP